SVARKAAKANQVRYTLWIRSGKHCAHRAAFGKAHQRRSRRADFFHHSANVIHPLLKRWSARYSVGQTLTSLIKGNNARKFRKATQESRISCEFVKEIGM